MNGQAGLAETRSLGRIKVDAYKCERCNHIWVPREYTDKDPVICPKCKSPYWNRAKK